MLDKYMLAYNEEKAVKVMNPVSEECTMLRQNLAVSLLNCLKYNYDNGQKNFWAYEIGKTYICENPADTKFSGVKETQILGAIISGEIENSKWQVTGQPDFYTIKGMAENLFEEFGIQKRIKFVPIEDSSLADKNTILHPYKSAAICLLGKQLTDIGYVGQVHPLLKDKMKLKQEAFIMNIDVDVLISIMKDNVPRYKHLPQFPEVKRDLAFVINDKVSYDDIQKVIKSGIQQNIFQGSEVFDVYQGENIEKGYKSLAFRIKMLDENGTLTDDIIERNIQSVREKLQKAYSDISFRE